MSRKKKSRLVLPKKNQKTKNKLNQITVNPHQKKKKGKVSQESKR